MALFIGGPLDGKLVEVDINLDHIEVAIEQKLDTDAITVNEVTKPTKSFTNIFFYKREILNCPTSTYTIFVPHSYSCDDVIVALIEGYHQGAVTQSPA